MKTIVFFSLLVVLFTSCSFEDKTKRRLPDYMKTVVADPEQSIEDETIIWSDDSLCIIEFNLRARNENGGYELSKYQYFLIKCDKGTFESANLIPNQCSFQHILHGETYEPNIKKLYHEYAESWGKIWGRKVED